MGCGSLILGSQRSARGAEQSDDDGLRDDDGDCDGEAEEEAARMGDRRLQYAGHVFVAFNNYPITSSIPSVLQGALLGAPSRGSDRSAGVGSRRGRIRGRIRDRIFGGRTFDALSLDVDVDRHSKVWDKLSTFNDAGSPCLIVQYSRDSLDQSSNLYSGIKSSVVGWARHEGGHLSICTKDGAKEIVNDVDNFFKFAVEPAMVKAKGPTEKGEEAERE